MQPTLPDVNLSIADKLYSSGAFFALGILAVFFIARWVTKHWKWLATGQKHVWATALVGGLATLVVPAMQGTTPNASMLTLFVVTMIGITADPKKVAAITGALGLAFMLHASSGCSWGKSEVKKVEAAAVDCTKGEEGRAVQLFSPLLEKLLVYATGGDGKIDKTQAEDATKTLAGDVGGCVAAKAFASILTPAPTLAGAPKSSPLVVDQADARAYFEHLRTTKFGGKTFQTEAGTL